MLLYSDLYQLPSKLQTINTFSFTQFTNSFFFRFHFCSFNFVNIFSWQTLNPLFFEKCVHSICKLWLDLLCEPHELSRFHRFLILLNTFVWNFSQFFKKLFIFRCVAFAFIFSPLGQSFFDYKKLQHALR